LGLILTLPRDGCGNTSQNRYCRHRNNDRQTYAPGDLSAGAGLILDLFHGFHLRERNPALDHARLIRRGCGDDEAVRVNLVEAAANPGLVQQLDLDKRLRAGIARIRSCGVRCAAWQDIESNNRMQISPSMLFSRTSLDLPPANDRQWQGQLAQR
jgi:hypothetical protein